MSSISPSILFERFDPDQDAEDILYELLHSLSNLPCPEEPSTVMFLLTRQVLLETAPALGEDEKQGVCCVHTTQKDIFEWKCGMILLRKLIGTIDDDDQKDDNQDTTAAERVSPHALLRCVVNRCLGFRDDFEDSGGFTMAFKIISTILVSEAIRTSYTKHDGQKRRWRRMQSMCMEAIHLYQTLFLRSMRGGYDYYDSNIRDPVTLDEFKMASSLYCDYLSPALCNLLGVMDKAVRAGSDRNKPNENKNIMIAAGMVNCVSSLSMYIAEHTLSEADDDIAASGNCMILDLTAEMLKVPLFRPDYIYLHPLRLEYENSRSGFHQECDNNDEDVDIESILEERAMREVSPLLCKNRDELGLDLDSLLGMNVQWNERGLAIMIHSAIAEDSNVSSFLFPRVYSKNTEFRLLFPSVSTLLSLSRREAPGLDQEGNKSGANRSSAISQHNMKCHRYLQMAMFLLKRIILMKGDQNLCTHGENGVLGPVGSIQLLLNHLVSSHNHGSQDQSSEIDTRVDATDLVRIIRDLLSCYSIPIQVSSIGKLVKLCPFPFLVPMLLDFLRHPVSSNRFSDFDDVVLILDPFLDQMMAQKSVTDVPALTENSEIYTSAVSLFRLLYLKFDSDHVPSKFDPTMLVALQSFRLILRDIEEKVGNDPGSFSHRIFLLQMALDDLVSINT